MLSVVIEAFKKFVMFLCTHLQINCFVYGDWAFEVTLHSPSARLGGIYPVQIHLIGIHLITTASITKRLSLYKVTLWGPDLVSDVRSRESPYYRGSFLKKIYENFVGILETVRNM